MSSRSLQWIGLALATCGAVYGILDKTPAPALPLLGSFIAWLAVAAWLPADAIAHRVPLVMDWGWFIAMGWPWTWLWYTRRSGCHS